MAAETRARKDSSLLLPTTERPEDAAEDDDDYTKIQLVLIVGVAMLMWGNLLTIVVNARLAVSPSRLYMSALAVADLVICLNYILFRLAQVGLFGESVPDAWYIILEVTFIWALLYSHLLLQIIAFDRYLAVCRPTTKFLTLRRVKTCLAASVPLALVPLGFEKLMAAFYNAWVGNIIGSAWWLLSTLVLLVLYVRIGFELVRRARLKRRMTVSPMQLSTSGNAATVSSSRCTLVRVTAQASTSSLSVKADDSERGEKTLAQVRTAQVAMEQAAGDSQVGRKRDSGQMNRTGLMLLAVTVIFVVCWVPFWMWMNGVDVPPLVRDFFIINSLANPLIYCCLSGSVRKRYLKVLTRGN